MRSGIVVGTEGSGREGWSLHGTARKFLTKVCACEHCAFRALPPSLEPGAERRPALEVRNGSIDQFSEPELSSISFSSMMISDASGPCDCLATGRR